MMRAPALAALLPISIGLLLSACSEDLTRPETQLRLGILSFLGQTAVIEAPGMVESGVPFTVTVETFGSGCVGGGPTQVEEDTAHVLLLPFDVHVTGQNLICTGDLRLFPHAVSLTLDQTGEALVRVRGLRVETALGVADTIELEQRITVR